LKWITKEYSNKVNRSTTIPADASVRLFIRVEAPGFVPYESAIRGKYNSNEFVEALIEMDKIKGQQGKMSFVVQ
jgi:hypothetical protein